MPLKKLTKNSRITLVELPPTEDGQLLFADDRNGRISHNVYSQFRLPSRSLHLLHAILNRDGWEDAQVIHSDYHGKKGRLTGENLKRILDSDALLVSAITATSPQTLKLIDMFNSANPQGWVISGGYDPTFRTKEYVRNGRQIAVIGEAEATFSELMNKLTLDPTNLSDIKGIFLFREGYTGTRQLLTSDELSSMPHPVFDKEVREKIWTAAIETSRGCPNVCEFCSIGQFFGEEYRREFRFKSVDYIIEELSLIDGMGKAIFYSADNLVGNPKHAIALLQAIAETGHNKRQGLAQVTSKSGKNDKLRSVLKNAGIEILCIGIESFNDQSLNELGKPYSSKDNIEGLAAYREDGFAIHAMMMPGSDPDTIGSLRQDLELVKKYCSTAQFFAPVPLPGTALRKRIENERRLLRQYELEKWELYNGHFVLSRPKNFSPYELQIYINQMCLDFYSDERNQWMREHGSIGKRLVYNFIEKGTKKVLSSKQMQEHLEFLKGVS